MIFIEGGPESVHKLSCLKSLAENTVIANEGEIMTSKIKVKSIRFPSTSAILIEIEKSFEDGSTQVVEKYYPLKGRGFYCYTLRAFHDYFSNGDGRITLDTFLKENEKYEEVFEEELNKQPQI